MEMPDWWMVDAVDWWGWVNAAERELWLRVTLVRVLWDVEFG